MGLIMISEGWKTAKLIEMIKINSQSISSNYPHEEIEYIDTSSVTQNVFDPPQIMKIKEAPSRAKRIVNAGDTIISTVRPIQRHYGFMKDPKKNTIVSTGFAVLTPKNIFPKFLYYYLTQDSVTEYLNGVAETTTTAYPAFSPDVLNTLEVKIPEKITEQRAIAYVLSSLDDKIELNRRMNATLEYLAQTLFKHWFIANPERVEWDMGRLGDVIDVYDSKRIPLSSREREKRPGIYPYYGATSIMGHIDGYLFDGIYLLVAEDGSVSDSEDRPVLQYVWGQFWVNNHAHILMGRNDISTEFIYLLLQQTNIQPYITGAVQLKLNQANMFRIPITIPPNELSLKFSALINPIFSLIRSTVEESRTLTELRDSLLPKLMRGELRVKVIS